MAPRGCLTQILGALKVIFLPPRRMPVVPGGSGTPPQGLVSVLSMSTPSGNSGWIDFSDDDKALIQANGETNGPLDNENAIDITAIASPKFTHQDATESYEWGVTQKLGVAIFVSSITSGVTRKDSTTWSTTWTSRSLFVRAGFEPSHSPGKIGVTDGTYLYLPNGGQPGCLIVINATTGAVITHVDAPDNWGIIDHRLMFTTIAGKTYCLVCVHAWLTSPYQPTATVAGTGGTFAPGTYYAKIAPVGPAGEAPAGLEVSATVAANGTITWQWIGAPGASSYKLYRGTTPGGENTYFTVTDNGRYIQNFVDTGAAGTAGTPAGTAATASGGIYIFEITNPLVPAYVGKIPGDTGSFAVAGSVLYRTQFNPVSIASDTFEGWSLATPSAPVHTLGTLVVPSEVAGGSGPQAFGFGTIDINAAGTRLYSGFSSFKYGDGQPTSNWYAGWVILDTTGANPVILASQQDGAGHPRGQSVSLGGSYMSMGIVRLSHDGTKVAVSCFNFGVNFYTLSGDTATLASQFATTGECKDAVPDVAGNFYVPSEQVFYEFDSHGVAKASIWEVQSSYGGFVPFKDGRFVIPGKLNNGARVYDFAGGPGSNIVYNPGLPWLGNAFDISYDQAKQLMYGSQNGGGPSFAVWGVGAAPSYPGTPLGDNSGDASTRTHDFRGISDPFTSGAYTLIATLSSDVGLAVWDVTAGQGGAAFTPTLLYLENLAFGGNGRFMHVVVARGYIFAACNSSYPGSPIPTYAKDQGDGGLRVYKINAGTPPTFTFVHNYHLNGTWLDKLVNPNTGLVDFLVFNSYSGGAGDGRIPDGVYLIDVRTTPGDPTLFFAPQPGQVGYGNGWRTRVYGTAVSLIYKIDLGGLEILSLANWP
jgi:hypothetical protein